MTQTAPPSEKLTNLHQSFHLVQQDRLVAELNQRLGHAEGEGAQPGAITANEDQRFHGTSSWGDGSIIIYRGTRRQSIQKASRFIGLNCHG